MLIYHQRNDIFHCIFRIFSILRIVNEKSIEIEKLKMLDFYIVFPHLINTITFPIAKGISKIKSNVNCLTLPYENLPNTKILFSEMGDFQSQAIDILRAKCLISINSEGLCKTTELFNNKSITDLTSNKITESVIFKELINLFLSTPLHGDMGLKKRTGLMEYRYDAT